MFSKTVLTSDDPRLDVARGASALIVFSVHVFAVFWYRIFGQDHWSALIAGTLAQYSVLVFFLLSGFLISKTIAANVNRFGGIDVVDYICARVARIYPPLILSILIAVAVVVLVKAERLPGGATPYGLPGDLFKPREYLELTTSDIAKALTMRGGMLIVNSALWSLYIEFSLYIAAMGVAGFLTWRGSLGARAIGILIAVGALVYGMRANEHFVFYAVIWSIGAGFLFAPRRIGSLFFPALVLLIAASIYDIRLFNVDRFDLTALGVRFLACLAIAALLFDFKWPRWLTHRWLTAAAPFSYTLYIIHAPMLALALSLTQNWAQHTLLRITVVTIGAFVLVIVAAMVAASCVERPAAFKRILLSSFLRTSGGAST